jgi:hypothetical protein
MNKPELTTAERRLADLARAMARDRNALFHGTRYARSILRTGVLFFSIPGEPRAAFTRSPEIAAYWAFLKRDDDEACGAILILDRKSLNQRYTIKRRDDVLRTFDEEEEAIWENVTNVSQHLIGFISEPRNRSSRELKARNHAFMREIETRLKYLGGAELERR